MSQINLYVPKEIEGLIRKRARVQKVSLSNMLTELITSHLQAPTKWKPDFFKKVAGGWQGDFPKISRDLPEPIEYFEKM